MHAKVNQGVGIKGVCKVVVKSCILRVRGEVAVEQQPHGVPLHSQHRLHPNPHIAHLHMRHTFSTEHVASYSMPLIKTIEARGKTI